MTKAAELPSLSVVPPVVSSAAGVVTDAGVNEGEKGSPPAVSTKAPPLGRLATLPDTTNPAGDGAAPHTSDARKSEKNKNSLLTQLSFLIMVVIPTILTGFYFFVLASPQFLVETQFAVRGSDQSPLLALGLTAIPGAANQDSDSYIVQNYIRSAQVVKDVKRNQGIDLRTYYARPGIDFLYKIAPDMPYIDFEKYWQWQTRVEFSSITGNTTLQIYAFDSEDAVAISRAVMTQAEVVVNELSKESRDQLIKNARIELDRAETRQREAQLALQKFQNETQTIDLASLAQAEATIIAGLQSKLAELKTRERSLKATVSQASPSMRVLQREIRSVETQIAQQRTKVGTGTNEQPATGSDQSNTLANISTRFVELTLATEFAKTAYTAAIQSLETALAEARKQQRYLATYVPPEKPEVSRHPRPFLYTAVALLWFAFLWVITVFVIRAVKDHTI